MTTLPSYFHSDPPDDPKDLCQVCGVSLQRRALPPDPGPYDWVRSVAMTGHFTFMRDGTVIEDTTKVVHGECLGEMNYFRWARIQAYQRRLKEVPDA